jgi:hypothetical protein
MTESSDIHQRLQRLEADVASLRGQRDIEDVLTRYSRALDWLDDAMLDTVFYDDAEIDYGFFQGSGREFKPLLMQVERSVGRRWHFTAQVKVEVDGDFADASSYNLSLAAEPVHADPPADFDQFFGYYVDRLARRAGRWGIIRRKHLLLTSARVRESRLEGPLARLNAIGPATPLHPDYRRLSRARAL